MVDYQVTLRVSPTVYEQAQRIAAQTAQPLEQVLEARLDSSFDALPIDEQTELAAFRQLADDTLLGMVGEQMPHALNERMITLGERTSHGLITLDEAAEYAVLVERGNRLLLRKAWAANILMDRGHKLSASDFARGE